MAGPMHWVHPQHSCIMCIFSPSILDHHYHQTNWPFHMYAVPLADAPYSHTHVCSPLGWCTIQSHAFYSHSCVEYTCAQTHSMQNQLYCAVMVWGSCLYLDRHCISSILGQCVIDIFLLEQCIETQNRSLHSDHIISVEDYDTLTHMCSTCRLSLGIRPSSGQYFM